MENIRRENGVIKAVYEGIEYIFKTTLELIIAYSTLRNIKQWEAKQKELELLDAVM
jgi:hypothetical protein